MERARAHGLAILKARVQQRRVGKLIRENTMAPHQLDAALADTAAATAAAGTGGCGCVDVCCGLCGLWAVGCGLWAVGCGCGYAVL